MWDGSVYFISQNWATISTVKHFGICWTSLGCCVFKTFENLHTRLLAIYENGERDKAYETVLFTSSAFMTHDYHVLFELSLWNCRMFSENSCEYLYFACLSATSNLFEPRRKWESLSSSRHNRKDFFPFALMHWGIVTN